MCAKALLEILSKAITGEINTTLKNECMACYNPAVQVHSWYLNNPREKVDRNFDNAFQLVDLWSANEMTFEKTKYKIQVAVKDKDLYLTRSNLLRNVFLMNRLKAAVMKLVLQIHRFFSLNFLSIYLFFLFEYQVLQVNLLFKFLF